MLIKQQVDAGLKVLSSSILLDTWYLKMIKSCLIDDLLYVELKGEDLL